MQKQSKFWGGKRLINFYVATGTEITLVGLPYRKVLSLPDTETTTYMRLSCHPEKMSKTYRKFQLRKLAKFHRRRTGIVLPGYENDPYIYEMS